MKTNFAPKKQMYGFNDRGGLNRTLNTYDPSVSAFDPNFFNGADGVKELTQQSGQVDLTLTNAAAVALTAELFNYNNSMFHKQNTNYSVAPYNYVPYDSYEGLNLLIAAYGGTGAPIAASALGTVNWGKAGEAIVSGRIGDPTLTIQCQQLCYRALFNSTSSTAFRILGMRLKVSDVAQLSNGITWFRQTFMGGKIENQINPLAQVDPTQFQDKIVDIPLNIQIDAQSGIYTTVNAGVTETMNLRVSSYAELKG